MSGTKLPSISEREMEKFDDNGFVLTTQGTASDRTNDAITNYNAPCTGTPVDTSDNTTTVNDAPSVLCGIYVNTVLSAHTVVIKDNATAKYTLPAGLVAGTHIVFPNPITFPTSLVVDPDDSSTGNITVEWRDA